MSRPGYATTDHTAQEIEAESLVEQAVDGELTHVGDYALRGTSKDEQVVKIPDLVHDNEPAEVGDDLPLYWSHEENALVVKLDPTDPLEEESE